MYYRLVSKCRYSMAIVPRATNMYMINSTSNACYLYQKRNQSIKAKSNINPSVTLFHTKTTPLYKDPESNAEKTSNLLKENIKTMKKESVVGAETTSADEPKPLSQTPSDKIDVPRKTLGQRIMDELRHYYHGFKLLYFETKIAFRLLKQVLQGHTLTRRERKQFTRTAADLFRLVPFSVFIIVPFMEFTLPIFLKLFPNMLPSTFQEQSKEQDNLKKKLKAKLEMAKFLQDTLEETALKASDSSNQQSLNQKFSEFMKKIRSKGEQPTNEDIMKYSSLFENELTLDNLSRQQLIALCQILDVSTFSNIPPNHILRFQLRMKIRNLEADDKMIIKEGVTSLDTKELQSACRERGMRAIGLSEERLKSQLEQWLDLHINRKIPISLLILSRALYLPENLPAEDLIKTTISALPKSIEDATIAKIAEVSGAPIDNKIKLELLKQEEAEIKLENATAVAEQEADKAAPIPEVKPVESPVPSLKPEVPSKPEIEVDLGAAERMAKEMLVDKAQVIDASYELLTPNEIKEINQIIENLPSNEKKQVKAEIAELKKDVEEYKEDVKEVEELSQVDTSTAKLTETKSAKILSKRVQKLINDVDMIVDKLEKEAGSPEQETATTKNTVSIDELVATIKKIRGISNDEKERRLLLVLQSLDQDKDGKIDDLNDVLKVFDLIEQENVKVSKSQLGKILRLLEKEKIIEQEEQKAASEQKQQQQQQQGSDKQSIQQ